MLVTEPPRKDSRPLEATVEAAVAGGVDAVLLRDKEASPESLLKTAKRLRFVTQGKARLIIHTDASVAREARADGLHGGSGAAPGLRGFSVHSVEEARRAAAFGADYLLGGTIFTSASHPGTEPAGLKALSALCATTLVPIIAIGGVVPGNAAACLRAGAAGVAALSAFSRASDPEAVARDFREALDSTKLISLTINGRAALLSEPMSIAEFLASRGFAAELVAVEHNFKIVPHYRRAGIMLAPGDTLEIVRMMAGG